MRKRNKLFRCGPYWDRGVKSHISVLSYLFCFLSLLGGIATLEAAGDDPESSPGDTPSSVFANQVQPILVRHCLVCHGPLRQEGDLRLDSYEHVSRRGHTGQSILGTGLVDSQLWDRVSTADEEIRMPKDRDALTPEDLAVLKEWTEAGSPWPKGAAGSYLGEEPNWFVRMLSPTAIWLRKHMNHAKVLAPVFILVLLGLVVLERRARARKRSVGPLRKKTGLLLAALVALGAIVQYRGQWRSAVVERNAALRQANGNQHGRSPFHIYKVAEPPRFGGRYYRGNDERSEKLFNGGFYSTAFFDLEMVDGRGEALAVGSALTADPGSSPGSIRLTITRAPQATARLFTDAIRRTVHLTTQLPLGFDGKKHPGVGVDYPSTPDEPVFASRIIEGERWQIDYPLAAVEEGKSGPAEGTVYLSVGWSTSSGRYAGEPHYAIQYQLSVVDGSIAPDSTLSMSVVYLVGRIYAVPEGKIGLDEWFSFRPIPTIEGENSEDPELLGIDEHDGAAK